MEEKKNKNWISSPFHEVISDSQKLMVKQMLLVLEILWDSCVILLQQTKHSYSSLEFNWISKGLTDAGKESEHIHLQFLSHPYTTNMEI